METRLSYVELDTAESDLPEFQQWLKNRQIAMEVLPEHRSGCETCRYTGMREDLEVLVDKWFENGVAEDLAVLKADIRHVKADKTDIADVMSTLAQIMNNFDLLDQLSTERDYEFQIVGDSLEYVNWNPAHRVVFQLMPSMVDMFDVSEWRQMYVAQSHLDRPDIAKWIEDHDLAVIRNDNGIRVIGEYDDMSDFIIECFDPTGLEDDYLEPVTAG